MELTSTNKFLLKISAAAALVAGLLLFLGASNSSPGSLVQGSDSTKTLNNTDEDLYSFFENEDGVKVKYEAYFKDGEITSIYRNGEKIPEDKIGEYEDIVHRRLTHLGLTPGVYAYDFDIPDWDQEKFNEDMDKLREDMKNFKFEWHDFDKEELKENMDKLKENLKDMKLDKFHFKFDDSELKDQLEKLGNELEKLKEDSLDIEVNLEKLHDNLDEVISKLDCELALIPGRMNKHIEIFADKNGKVKHKVKIYKDNLKDSDEFIDKLKDELVNDKIISDREDFESFELTANKLLINGEKQADKLYKKYKKLYEEYSGNELEGNYKIRIQE